MLVLHPAYPQHLRNRKLYLADGVIAAFECKLTLRGRHIPAAAETGAAVKRLYRERTGTPYSELHRPIIYGLLAHSSDYAGTASNVTFKVQNRLKAALLGVIEHPSEMLDVVCVADAGILCLSQDVAIGSGIGEHQREILEDVPGGIISSYFGTSVGADENRWDPPGAALGQLISYLLRKMAWEDTSLRRLSGYFEDTLPFAGIAQPIVWTAEVLSDAVIRKILRRGFEDDCWSEWHNIFF